MASIKSFLMKNISMPKEENGIRFRKGVLYTSGAKVGYFHYYESGKEPFISIREQFQKKWNQDVQAFYEERANNTSLSPEVFFVEQFVELIDYEKRYRVQQKQGYSHMVEYIELLVDERDGKRITRPSGRRVLLNVDNTEDIEVFEQEELSDMTFERKLFSSPNDFIIN